MSRYLLSLLTVVLLVAATKPQCQAQSGTQGSGRVIQSQPIQQGGSSIQRTYPQGGVYQGRTIQQGSSMAPAMPRETFESKFWKYLKGSRYTQWSPVPGKTGDVYAGQSPHGATLKMYLNRKAAGRPTELPDSSILVKENFGPDGKTLMAITVMYKTTKYNPEAGDWYWIKYLPDGRVDQKQTPNGAMRLAGKPKGCIECHVAAKGGDYAFFNDGP